MNFAFESFGQFLSMDGEALYVWLAYGIAAIVVGLNVWLPKKMKKDLVLDHKRRLRREK